MENKIKEKQDIIIRIINDPDLGEWIVALITGEKADTPQDETTAEILKKLGYVQEDNDVWTITEEGKRFAEKLGLVETTKLFEDEKLPKLVSKSSAIKTKVKVSSQPLSKKPFYENEAIVEGLKKLEKPKREDLEKLIEVMKEDYEVSQKFYDKNDNKKWLTLLKGAGEFEQVTQAERDDEGGVRYRGWPQSRYLAAVAEKAPEEVLGIIKDFDTDNIFIIRDCLHALLAMPVEVAVGGMELVRRLLGKKVYPDWHFVGAEAAKLMVKFTEDGKIEVAFEIAEKLLEVEIKEGDYFRSWHDLKGRYSDHEYRDLVFKYFIRLWEREGQGLRAANMLIEKLNEQIEEDKKRKEKEPIPPRIQKKYNEVLGGKGKEEQEEIEYDPTQHSYIIMPSLEKLKEKLRDIAEVIVEAICRIGRHLIDNEGSTIEELIKTLRTNNKVIFTRIELYLLRFVPEAEKWNQYISKLIGDMGQFNVYELKEEYEALLLDKWEVIHEDVQKLYIKWAEGQKLENEEEFKKWFLEYKKREPETKDIEEYNNKLRAEALYCIRDKETELYEKYLKASGRNEEDVKPRPRTEMKVEWAGAPEKSPLKPEQMREMEPVEVIKRVIEYDKTLTERDVSRDWDRDEKMALANAFKQDVIERAREYLQVEVNLIVGLSSYVSDFFYGIDEAFNTKKIENPDWGRILEIAKNFVNEKGMEEEYSSASRVIPRILERGFKMDSCKMAATEKNLDRVWDILTRLLEHDDGEDVSDDGDPLTGSMNCVQGAAFENIVRFGLFCKNENPDLFASRYASRFRRTLQNVLDNIEKVKIQCVFGVYFFNLCWIDEKWVRDNLDRIFPEDDDRRWDGIWGSYVYWSRATKQGFDLAKDKYAHAIGRIGQEKRFEHRKDADKKLVDHLMTAYWHGWNGEDGLLEQFLDKAGDELRAEASHFLSTGFKELKEEEKDEWRKGVEKRLLAYWERRYATMRENPGAHKEEAQEFTGWVKDSPFEKGKALEIADKSVELTGGNVGKRRDVGNFVNGVCEVAEGHELKGLELIRKVMDEPDIGISTYAYEKNLTELMQRITELPDNKPGVEDIRRLAIDIADTFGRLGIDNFKGHYESLKARMEMKG